MHLIILIISLVMSCMTCSSLGAVLYDMPVSNHGARIRAIIYGKGITNDITIKEPSSLGGMKSEEYMKLNPLGKMPLLVDDDNYPIPESDVIARYICDKYSEYSPSFIPTDTKLKVLNDQICRWHDVYISNIQGCMYKAPGTPFAHHGSNRKAALNELKQRFTEIEDLVTNFETKHYPNLCSRGGYLCGNEISLADATLFPTAVFLMFMLPTFFQWKQEEVLGPRLTKWYNFMLTIPYIKKVFDEMIPPLNKWKDSGRFDPIIQEMKQQQ